MSVGVEFVEGGSATEAAKCCKARLCLVALVDAAGPEAAAAALLSFFSLSRVRAALMVSPPSRVDSGGSGGAFSKLTSSSMPSSSETWSANDDISTSLARDRVEKENSPDQCWVDQCEVL